MDIDLNSSLPYVNISDLMDYIATIDNTSEKVEKLIDYVKELNAELTKIKESKSDSPLCILILTEAIQKLEKETMQYYTDINANKETDEHVPMEDGNSKKMKALKKSSYADKKNWMSSVQLGSNNVAYDTTKHTSALHGSSAGLMREDVVANENPKIKKSVNFNESRSAFMPYKRPSGVIISESSNVNNVQHSFIGMVGLSSFNMNFSGSYVTNLSYHPPSLIDPSKKPRLSWTHDLHHEFMRVVDDLGGPAAATPKQIRERMPMYNLTNDEVKSHLQKYRVQLRKCYLATKTSSAAPP